MVCSRQCSHQQTCLVTSAGSATSSRRLQRQCDCVSMPGQLCQWQHVRALDKHELGVITAHMGF